MPGTQIAQGFPRDGAGASFLTSCGLDMKTTLNAVLKIAILKKKKKIKARVVNVQD